MTIAECRADGRLLRFTAVRSSDLTPLLRELRRQLGYGTVRRAGSALTAPARQLTWLLEPGAAERIGVRLDPSAVRALGVRRHAHAVHAGYRGRVRDLRDNGVEAARTRLARRPTRQCIDALDEHQIVNLAAMTDPDGYGMCLFDEQGAGKTVSVIYAFDRLVDLNIHDWMLVVAPKSMVGEWANAIREFMGDRYRVAVIAGSAAERQQALASGADVLVANYEAVASVGDALVRQLRRNPDRALLVVDESFNVKNPDARRTRDLESIRDWFGRVWMLCGTPAPNSAHDIVAQIDLVDFGQTFDGVVIPKDRAAAVPVVRRALDERAIYLRNLKADVLPELPGKVFTRVVVPLAPTQSQLYTSALGSLIADVEALDEAQFLRNLGDFLSRRMALLRIASNPSGIFPNYDEIPGKLAALDDIVDRLVVQSGDKLVVWSCFTASLDAIVRRYEHLGAVRYDGTVTAIEARRAAVHRFQTDADTRVFVANPAAAGAGLTLHAARYAVYESFTNQAAHYLQSLDRIHRRGQKRQVEYLVLLAESSIEPHEFDRLVAKEERARDLLGDAVEPPVTRERFLTELRGSEQGATVGAP
ncbi:DEAD/DEAH box helicase [Geodermatophilus marinus]|uniref:DEAD/DEAH box helicase n=1 Tax=Geodermatophilus sp. LHW52908 TaxID=2303986 RepID=UPI000E3D5D3B|nr:DEAD/DEAH box helicase [Geodermatophilus sp. LHW52908]RFU21039.1 DEAD/DEAH box helicase [Geodermatophilus sp. LHW52908]